MAVVNLSGSIGGTTTLSGETSVSTALRGSIAGVSTVTGHVVRFWWPQVSLAEGTADVRRLTWDTTEPVKVVLDGILYRTVSSDAYLDMDAEEEIRQYLEVLDDLPNTVHSPMDRVTLSWDAVTNASYYEVERSADGGSTWTEIHEVDAQETLTYVDGPLTDGSYQYRVAANNDLGVETDSNTASLTVSSAPEPPSGLSVSVSGGTVTLSWTASSSADAARYHIYRSVSTGDPVVFDGSPYARTASTSWSEDVSGVTGELIYAVRTADSDEIEEANIDCMVSVTLSSGTRVLPPNAPTIKHAEPIAAGELRAYVQYKRSGEQGEATSINLYADDGAGGAVDYGSAVGTATLDTTASVEIVEVNTSGLDAGKTYVLAAKAETDAAVEGNASDTYSATTQAPPSAPVLSGELL